MYQCTYLQSALWTHYTSLPLNSRLSLFSYNFCYISMYWQEIILKWRPSHYMSTKAAFEQNVLWAKNNAGGTALGRICGSKSAGGVLDRVPPFSEFLQQFIPCPRLQRLQSLVATGTLMEEVLCMNSFSLSNNYSYLTPILNNLCCYCQVFSVHFISFRVAMRYPLCSATVPLMEVWLPASLLALVTYQPKCS